MDQLMCHADYTAWTDATRDGGWHGGAKRALACLFTTAYTRRLAGTNGPWC